MTGQAVGTRARRPGVLGASRHGARCSSPGAWTTLHGMGFDTFVEIGPHPVLSGMGQACVPAGTGTWVPSLRRKRDDDQQLLDSLAAARTSPVSTSTGAASTRRAGASGRRCRRTRSSASATGSASAARPPLATTRRAPAARPPAALAPRHRHLRGADRRRRPRLPRRPPRLRPGRSCRRRRSSRRRWPPPPTAVACVLDDVVIHEALVADEDRPATLQTIVVRAGALVRDLQPGRRRRPVDAGTRRAASARTAPARRRTVSLEAIRDPVPRRGRRRLRTTSCSPTAAWSSARACGASAASGVGDRRGARRGRAARGRGPPRSAGTGSTRRCSTPAIQVLAAVAARGADTYLPISVDRVALFAEPSGTAAWSHVVLRPGADLADRPETMTADVALYEPDGRPLARLDGLHLKRADQDALLRLGRRERPRRVAATRSPGARSGADARRRRALPRPRRGWRRRPSTTWSACAASTGSTTTRACSTPSRRQHRLHRRRPRAPRRAHRARCALLRRAARRRPAGTGRCSISCSPTSPTTASCAAPTAGGRSCAAPAVDTSEARWHELLERYPAGRGELTITRRCGEQLAEALTGAVDPAAAAVPRRLARGRRADVPAVAVRPLLQLAGRRGRRRRRRRPARRAPAAGARDRRRHRRHHVVRAARGCRPAASSTRTPTCRPHFLGRARQKFAALPVRRLPHARHRGRPRPRRASAAEQFDIVVAANVLHATADLRHTFANVAAAAGAGRPARHGRDGAAAALHLDHLRPDRGWWKFTDRDLRPASLLLGREGWRAFLASQGFVDPQVVPPAAVDGPERAGRAVRGRWPGARRDGRQPICRPTGVSWLILADDGGVGDERWPS